MSEQEQQTMTAEDLPDMEGFLRQMGAEAMTEDAPPPPDPEVETIPINGMEYQVPKAVARALEQGRRFQGEKDQLQVALSRQEAELAAFKAQMDSIQSRLMQPQAPAQPQGPSEFVRAWQDVDKALGLEGVFEGIGKMQEAMLSKRDSTLSAEQQKMLDAFKAQQEQIAQVSQQTQIQQLGGRALQEVQRRMTEESVDFSEDTQSQVVARFMERQAAHNFSDETKDSDFTAAWYQGMAESLRNKASEPALSFGGRPPVSAPIPASRGGMPGQGFARKPLPRSDEYLSGL